MIKLNLASPQARGLVSFIAPSYSSAVIADVARGGALMRTVARGGGSLPTLVGSALGGWGTLFQSQDHYYTDAAFTGIPAAANATIVQWVYIPDTSRLGVFVKVGGGTSGFGLGVGATQTNNSGNNLVGIYEFVRYIASGVAIGTGWHLCGMTVNASGFPTLYLDGRSVYSDTSGTPSAPSAGINVGYSGSINGLPPSGCGFLHGLTYNRALSDAEMRALYDPQTRWDLYYVPGRRVYFDLGATPTGRTSRLSLVGVA